MSPEQCKMARAGLGISVRRLAELSSFSTGTIVKFEGGEHRLNPRTLKALREALEAQGAVFSEDGGVR